VNGDAPEQRKNDIRNLFRIKPHLEGPAMDPKDLTTTSVEDLQQLNSAAVQVSHSALTAVSSCRSSTGSTKTLDADEFFDSGTPVLLLLSPAWPLDKGGRSS
jgi:hypothetical protein